MDNRRVVHQPGSGRVKAITMRMPRWGILRLNSEAILGSMVGPAEEHPQ